MDLLIKNIKGLVHVEGKPVKWLAGADMKKLNVIENAYLVIKDNKIEDFGKMDDLKFNPDYSPIGSGQAGRNLKSEIVIDAAGKFVFPCFVDSHTHLVYAASREDEFVDRIKGLSYEEIARKGGGILNSAKRLQKTSEDELFESALIRVNEIMGLGTGAVEIKSGYGLTLEDEIKMLRVIKRLKKASPVTIKATFLGAHAIPISYSDRKDYIDLIVEKMIPKVAEEKLADYCDVFCDRGFFTPEETDRILEQGLKYGLKPKIHANELDYSGGIQCGVAHNALSVDHLEYTGDEEIELLLNSETMPTLLPGTAFFLGLNYPPARKMIDAGLPVALASDYNPGSSPSGNMPFILSLACIKLKMTPEEAINAATTNGAYALGLEKSHGSIAKGKAANVFITKEMPSYAFLPYAFGSSLIETVIINGLEIGN